MTDKNLREHQTSLSLFQPDVRAPLQYLDRWLYHRRQCPEFKLMLADGIASFQNFFRHEIDEVRRVFVKPRVGSCARTTTGSTPSKISGYSRVKPELHPRGIVPLAAQRIGVLGWGRLAAPATINI